MVYIGSHIIYPAMLCIPVGMLVYCHAYVTLNFKHSYPEAHLSGSVMYSRDLYRSLQTEKVLYLVTEPVVPLETYLKNNEQYATQNELAISWGLHQLTVSASALLSTHFEYSLLSIVCSQLTVSSSVIIVINSLWIPQLYYNWLAEHLSNVLNSPQYCDEATMSTSVMISAMNTSALFAKSAWVPMYSCQYLDIVSKSLWVILL